MQNSIQSKNRNSKHQWGKKMTHLALLACCLHAGGAACNVATAIGKLGIDVVGVTQARVCLLHCVWSCQVTASASVRMEYTLQHGSCGEGRVEIPNSVVLKGCSCLRSCMSSPPAGFHYGLGQGCWRRPNGQADPRYVMRMRASVFQYHGVVEHY